MTKFRTTAAFVLGTLAISAAYAHFGAFQTRAKVDGKGVQNATIVVNNGFSPSTIIVMAGKPVQLTFDVRHKACAATVVFKDFKITKQLDDGHKTIVRFTPKKAGTIPFACGMNMIGGSIVVK